MDRSRFDTLRAVLNAAPSRRAAVRLLGGLGLAGLLGPAEAKKKPKKKPCAKAGQPTSKKRTKCCRGLVRDGSGVCSSPRPDCIPAACGPTSCGAVPDGCGRTLSCGGCAGNRFCVGGVCLPCSVTCLSGDPDICGEDLRAALDEGGTLTVCPGRYRGNFSITTNASVTGAGDGAAVGTNTILQGTGTTTVVTIATGTTVNLARLRITGGAAASFGGGISNDGGTLTVTGCTVNNNQAGIGAGIRNNAGTVHLIDSKVVDNQATGPSGGGIGGGIDNTFGGMMHLINSLVSGEVGNTAAQGGGINNSFGSTVTLDDASRVTGNTATGGTGLGGGIFNYDDSNVTLSSVDNVTGNIPENCAGKAVPMCED